MLQMHLRMRVNNKFIFGSFVISTGAIAINIVDYVVLTNNYFLT
jgi:hypothetical protein